MELFFHGLSIVTTIILGLVVYILNGINDSIKEIRRESKDEFDKIFLQFANHLEHHRQNEVMLAERLTRLEDKK